MMALLFGQSAHTVHKVQRLLEVRKLELTVQVMVLRDRPLRNILVQIFQFLPLERRNASAAGHAFLVGKLFGHKGPLKSKFNFLRQTADQIAGAATAAVGVGATGTLK